VIFFHCFFIIEARQYLAACDFIQEAMLPHEKKVIIFSSSSFIKPPANGHHRWSGAGKNDIFHNFLQFFF
jgi:hypothetical protein